MSNVENAAFCGQNRAYVYEKGGEVLVGELVSAFTVRWQRIRDAISNAQVSVSMNDCCDILELIEPVAFELHIYRNDELVWCGVITRMEFEYDRVDIVAEDMLWVAKRRAVSEGYNYQSYPQNIDAPQGPDPSNPTVGAPNQSVPTVQLMEYLLRWQCYAQNNDEWNMVDNIQRIDSPANCDSRTARQTNAWSTTVWAEFDKLAEDNGTDYAVVGRDIYFWDINLNWLEIDPLLPADIADYPRIVEYGNSLATRYIRTNGSGFAGIASAPPATRDRYAISIDIVSNENSQAEATTEVPPPLPSQTTINTWTQTAERRLSNAYPVERSIVVPANSTLMPSSPWDINTLIPGCWFEVSVDRLCRGEITEYNRLHELKVVETGDGGETVSITTIQPPTIMILPTDPPCDPSTGLPLVESP